MRTITHKLVEEVLKIRIHKRELIVFEDRIDFVYCTLKESEPRNKIMNIHEFAHRCKTWARDNYFFLRSFYDYEGAFCYISAPEWVDKIDIPKTGFSSDTEPEAIFKACEWIFKSLKVLNDK